ncbi:MAG: hypothetical protein HY286_00855 [Planctomycetes bacterium]|nr:hypothetical protein [Planctomycetota bacterium]
MIIFIGLRGSGKSTLGRALADSLERPFLDLDEDVERVAKTTIAQLMKKSIEEFRKIEHECLERTILGAPESLILAVGGGAAVQAENVRFFQFGVNIYLTCPVALIAKRIAANPGTRPPLTAEDPVSEIVQLNRQRMRTYQKLADITVSTDATIPEALAEVIKKLELYKISERMRFARIAGAAE